MSSKISTPSATFLRHRSISPAQTKLLTPESMFSQQEQKLKKNGGLHQTSQIQCTKDYSLMQVGERTLFLCTSVQQAYLLPENQSWSVERKNSIKVNKTNVLSYVFHWGYQAYLVSQLASWCIATNVSKDNNNAMLQVSNVMLPAKKMFY